MNWSESENLKSASGYDLKSIIQIEAQEIINRYMSELPVQDAIIKICEEMMKLEIKYNIKINYLKPNLDF